MINGDRIHIQTSLASEHTRLLTLLPGKPRTELRGQLTRMRLNESQPPIYEGLSYTWGSTEDPGCIYLGTNSDTKLNITKNLEVALLHLRHAVKSRVLWIDAICVNQQDLDERTQQVQRIANTYTLADRVVACLGEAADDSGLALRALQDIGSKIKVD
jgi:hypothetical protein